MCGNLAAAARAIGFSYSSVYERRRKWPDFARRLEEALEDADLRIEFRMASMGSDLDAAALDEAGGREARASGDPAAMPAEVVKFDPDLALRFLKWREEKKRAGGSKRGRPAARREPTIEEVRDEVVRRIAALRRHQERQAKRADEAGE